jgi:hypothetical protein
MKSRGSNLIKYSGKKIFKYDKWLRLFCCGFPFLIHDSLIIETKLLLNQIKEISVMIWIIAFVGRRRKMFQPKPSLYVDVDPLVLKNEQQKALFWMFVFPFFVSLPLLQIISDVYRDLTFFSASNAELVKRRLHNDLLCSVFNSFPNSNWINFSPLLLEGTKRIKILLSVTVENWDLSGARKLRQGIRDYLWNR